MERLSQRAARDRIRTNAIAITIGAGLVSSLAIPLAAPAAALAAAPSPTPVAAATAEGLGRLPIRFEENKGQAPEGVDFVARVGGAVVFLTPKGAVLSVVRTKPATEDAPETKVREAVFMDLAGANPKAKAVGVDRLPGATNYFSAGALRTDVNGYAQVRYEKVYKGVDLVYRGGPDGLAYDFEVAPGADPSAIALDFKGARGVRVDAQGDLVLEGDAGPLRQSRPMTYQDAAGGRRTVGSRFAVEGERVRFHVDGYDRGKKLVIDPVLAFSTFLGGNGEDAAAVASDSSGAYVAGSALSLDFPATPGAVDVTRGGFRDAFVAKVAPSGSSLLYATYLGGSNTDEGRAIAVDGSGQAFVTGSTSSVDFPTTAGSLDASRTLTNGITVKGSDLYRASSASFSAADVGKGIVSPNLPGGVTITALVSSSSVRISAPASTSGTGLTYTIGPPGTGRAFVTRLNANGTALGFSTFLGGGGGDTGRGIAVDGSGRPVVTGLARAARFPTTATAFDANRSRTDGASTVDGDTYTSASAAFSPADVGRFIIGANILDGTTVASVNDATSIVLSSPATATGTGLSFTLGNHSQGTAFVTRLTATGAALDYSTYLAGTASEDAFAIALAGAQPVVTGVTRSTDFPVVGGAQPTAPGGEDAFVTKIDMGVSGNGSGVPSPSNAALVFSTYLGGTDGGERGQGVAIDGGGAVYVTGVSASTDFPTTAGAPDTICNPFGFGCPGKAFVAKLAATGAAITYATYLGGAAGTEGRAIFVDAAGAAHVTGAVDGDGFPTVLPVEFFSGNGDAFLTKLAPAGTSFTYSTYLGGSGTDAGNGVAADGSGGAYIVGGTGSPDLPTTPSAFDATSAGSSGFVARLTTGGSPPAIRSLGPAGGPSTGGTPVVITGAGFTGATKVTFGDLAAQSFTVDSDTQITARAPESQQGVALVRVTGPNGATVFAKPYLFAIGIFQPTGACAANCGRLAALLANGKVLSFTPGPSGVANLYDPATGTWAPTGACTSCAEAVFNNAPLIALPAGPPAACGSNCGKVLYMGGRVAGAANQPSAKSAFLYDSAAGTWSPAADMLNPRIGHTATLLPSGSVLVAGGCATQRRSCGPTTGSPTNGDVGSVKAELFNPATGAWTATGDLLGPRGNHSAALITTEPCGSSCGKVLVAGGFNNGSVNTLDTAELYDPTSGTWSAASPMRRKRALHLAVQERTGRVLQIGSYVSDGTSDLYSPATNTWANLTSMAAESAFGRVAAETSSGRVLAASPAQIHDPGDANFEGGWALAAPALVDHSNGTATALPLGPLSACGANCGKVLVAGEGTSTELFTPEPTLDGIAPDNGPGNGGTVVTITGTGLAPVTSVTFGGVPGTNVVHDAANPDSTLTVVSPPNPLGAPGGVDVYVVSAGGRSSSSGFFQYNDAWTGPAVADFDGDFDSDRSVFRPSTGQWFINTGNPEVTTYGGAGDIAVPADYNGDNITDKAVYRPSTGQWFIRGGAPEVVAWGAPCASSCTTTGDIPVPGDYNGDGADDIAVFRPSQGVWYVRNGATVGWGANGDIPVPGDYDGDGFTDIAVFRPSNGTWYVRNGATVGWGTNGDIPVPGDYNGDGVTDIAVFRPTAGIWFVRNGATVAWGTNNDVPVPADYDGNGTTDIAVFRRSQGTWYVRNGSPDTLGYGAPTDIPLPLPYALRIAAGLLA